jgi:hypothetical protein
MAVIQLPKLCLSPSLKMSVPSFSKYRMHLHLYSQARNAAAIFSRTPLEPKFHMQSLSSLNPVDFHPTFQKEKSSRSMRDRQGDFGGTKRLGHGSTYHEPCNNSFRGCENKLDARADCLIRCYYVKIRVDSEVCPESSRDLALMPPARIMCRECRDRKDNDTSSHSFLQ